MSEKKKIVIVGATSAIAEHCARHWLKNEPVDLVLLGRDKDRIHRVAQDLKVRNPSSEIRIVETNFLESATIQITVDDVMKSDKIDIVLIAHGSLPDQSSCQSDLHLCRETLEINGVSPVLFAEAFAQHMEKTNHGTLVMIGSVAGDRGRQSNYVYGAAKGLVARYAQGLQHRFAGTPVKIVLIKPGPTDTPMTNQFKAKGVKMASVENVAKTIVDGVERGQSVIYAPSQWRLIMWIIKHLPSFVFNKMLRNI